jgi:polysaccharide deacetylase 2 family uncharacterized protein YibQ
VRLKAGELAAAPRSGRLLVSLLLASAILAGGCHKAPPPTAELRQVTHEFVAAAQQANGRKSEITIRPEMASPQAEGPPQLSTDHIYITLADPARKAPLEEALDRVARRHGLERTPVHSAAGIIRFDYEKGGRPTHAIHVITPVPPVVPVAEALPRSRPGSQNARLAIILDDLGSDRASADALLSLGFPLTISVLPYHSLSTEIAEEAYRRGDQVLLHLPMASAQGDAKMEAIELRPGMTPEEVDATLGAMLETVPHAAGVNNHQGSLATSDPQLMDALMRALHRRGLFFIDSRTTDKTVAYETAQRARVPAGYRKVFLDDTATRQAVLKQLAVAEKDAKRDGWAIAIGHPHPGTLTALEEALPRLRADGIHLVFASELAPGSSDSPR